MKKLLSFILGICLIIPCAFFVTGCKDKEEPVAKMETWDGTVLEVSVDDADENGVITIDSAEELAGFAKAVNAGETFAEKTIRLACDMDMANRTWTPIGVGNRSNAVEAKPFVGTFDGNDHKIIGLNSGDYATSILADGHKTRENDLETEVYTYHYGFFGYVTGATIKDLEITVNFNCNEANLKGDSVGGLVGFSSGALTITDCEVNGTINGGYDSVGGLVGRAYGSTASAPIVITDCENNANVTALYKAAGIVGYASSDAMSLTIDDCENNGTINAIGVNTNSNTVKRFSSMASGMAIFGWRTNKDMTVIITNNENHGDIIVCEALSSEVGRDNLIAFSYVANCVAGQNFDEDNHTYDLRGNTNSGTAYYLGKEFNALTVFASFIKPDAYATTEVVLTHTPNPSV